MEAILDASPAPVTPMPRKKRDSRERFAKRIDKLSFEAVDCLEELMLDSDVKPADRIAAAKLTFEVLQRQSAAHDPDEGGTVRVVIEGIEPELAE